MTANHSWDGTRPAIPLEFAKPEEREARICGFCGKFEVEPVYEDGKRFKDPIGWRKITDGWCTENRHESAVRGMAA